MIQLYFNKLINLISLLQNTQKGQRIKIKSKKIEIKVPEDMEGGSVLKLLLLHDASENKEEISFPSFFLLLPLPTPPLLLLHPPLIIWF